MDIEKKDLVSQIRNVQDVLTKLQNGLLTGVDRSSFLDGIKDAEDGLKRLRALLIYHTRVHKQGIRRDGKPDLRFTGNRLGPAKVDLRRPLGA